MASSTRSVPPAGIAWMALVARLATTWCTCVASPSTAARPACSLACTVTLGGNFAKTRSSTSRTTRSTWTGTRSPTALRLKASTRSTSARPRSPATMMLSRSRARRLPFGRVAQRHLAVAEDRAEDVVEVVSDSARKRSHRLEALRLAQLALHRLQLLPPPACAP